MADILSSVLGGANAAGSILNSVFGFLNARSQNAERARMNDQITQFAEQLRSQGISNPEQYLQSILLPLLNSTGQTLGEVGGLQPQFLTDLRQQLLDYGRQTIPNLMMPTDLMAQYNSPQADVGRNYDTYIQDLQRQMNNTLSDPAYNTARDRTSELANGQDMGLASMGERGVNLLDQFGTTGYNLNAQDAAGRAISAGGNTPQIQGLYDAGNSLFSSGGMSPQLDSLASTAQTNLDSTGSNYSTILQRLLAPQTQQNTAGFDPSLSTLLASATSATPLTGTSGYTGENLTTLGQGVEGLQQLLNRNGDIDNINAAATQALSGNLPGADQYGDMINQIMSQYGSLIGGGFGLGGGGGASGGSAGGLIAMDPDLQAMLAKGRKLFETDPLLSMEAMVSGAIDQSDTAAAQRAEQAQRYAAARGGGGAIVNTGAANRAVSDFADEAMRSRAQAARDAMLKRQELGLTQQIQGGQVGVAASNADTNRQQVAASRDIATANNATQASVANAQIANAQNQLRAQLQAAGLQAGLSAATTARGQNYGRSQSGLEALLAAQTVANNRGQIFGDVATKSLTDATQRYGVGAQLDAARIAADAGRNTAAISALPNLLKVNADFNNNTNKIESDRLATAMTGNNQLAEIMAKLGLGVQETATNRIGQGLTAMAAAPGMATNNLTAYGRIGNDASADQLARMGLGGNLVNSNLNTRMAANTLLPNIATAQNNAYGNNATLWNNGSQAQASIWDRLFQNDFNNRTLGANLFENLNATNLGFAGQLTNALTGAYSPLTSFGNAITQYAGNNVFTAGNLMGSLSRNTPAYQSPYPQFQLPTNMIPTGQQQTQQNPFQLPTSPTGVYSGQLPISTSQSQMPTSTPGFLSYMQPTANPWVSSPNFSIFP